MSQTIVGTFLIERISITVVMLGYAINCYRHTLNYYYFNFSISP